MDDKTEKENLFHHFFIELLLEHVTVNETGAFGIPPDKGNRVQYFVYTLPFYKQPLKSKQSSHIELLMLTQAYRNRGAGRGAELIEITNFYVNVQEKCFN